MFCCSVRINRESFADSMNNSSNKHPESNRRDFLTGKSAIRSWQSNVAVPLQKFNEQDVRTGEPGSTVGISPLHQRQAAYLEQYSKNAMACEFEFFFNLHQYRQSATSVMSAFQLIDDLEEQMSVYRAHSEISTINRFAANKEVPVESTMFELLLVAKELYEQTAGAFDITSGALTKLWRFDRRAGVLPTQLAIDEIMRFVGSNQVDLDSGNKTIRFAQPGIEINLGGIGKGHALDRVAAQFRYSQINDFMIHGGQSSVLAAGASTEIEPGPDQGGWRVGLTHPTLPGVRLAEITLRNQALGTSGTARQGFFHLGQWFGHIIDPRTGWPTSHFLSTTVITDSAARADALATAFYVLNLDEILGYCEQHPEVGVILVSKQPVGEIESSGQPATGHVLIQTVNLEESSFQVG